MQNSLKGALLSGLVFPGLGQFALKHYKRATVIALATVISLSVVIVKAVQHALTLLEQIESQGGNVWCSHCAKVTTIVHYTGKVKGGDLILEGECERCGGKVVRLIENE